MKKLFFAAAFAVAGCILPTESLYANPIAILQNTKIKSQQAVSISNLGAVHLAANNYMAGNKKYPALTELDVPVQTLVNPYRGLNAHVEVPEKISDANSGYAYFGAALNGTRAASVADTTPLAFEKPSVRPDGKIVVLYLDGKAEVVNTKAKTCAEAAAELKKSVEKPDAAVWDAIEKTAKAIDSATE